MKKYLWIICLTLLPLGAQAQMADMLGTLAIDNAITSSDLKGVEQMQKALSTVQFQEKLTELNTEIQTKFFGNYAGISKADLDFAGFKGLGWNVGSDSGAEYYVELSGADSALCHYIRLNSGGAKRIKINGGQTCEKRNNTLRLFY